MMNQGGSSNIESVTQLDHNSMENRQVAVPNQGGADVYLSSNLGVPSTTGSKAVSWTLQWTPNGSTENGATSNCSYYHGQRTELSTDAQDSINAASHGVTSSSMGASQVPQEYPGYASYSSSTEYNYDNTGYQGYYYGYQQQANNTYPQPQQVGAYQNSGAPYQPLTSFQNSGSYAGSTSYSSTYYNTGDYQTTGSYPSGSYSNQTTSWSDGNYASYPSHQYSNYTASDSNASHGSSTVTATSLSYEQQYKQWAEYYNQTAPGVSCAPGTENMSVTGAPAVERQIPTVTSSYPVSDSQPPPPGTTSWRQEPSSSGQPPLQAAIVTGDTQNGYWKHSAPEIPSHHISQTPSYSQTPSFFQKPLDSNPVQYDNSQELQKSACPQGQNLQFPPMHQIPQNYNSPLQTVSSFDTRRVNKMQIPTNPKIASTLGMGLPKTDKDAFTTEATAKPAYISVSVPKTENKVPSLAAADSMLKPGTFPTSLRAYVERALARCKNDLQKAACQNIMKEMITNASADGTLFTRDWDIEPLFPLPDMDVVNKDNLQSSGNMSSLSKFRRSPSRRTKSRWEPLPEEKLVEKLASINNLPLKDNSWDYAKDRDKKISDVKSESKEGIWTNAKFIQSHLQNQSKNSQRPAKKLRLGDSVAQNGDASSDSDKEQGLSAYYSAAIALADNPEEKRRRENRSKRFDKGQGQRAEIKHFRPKAGAGNLYTKRANALVLSKSFDDGGSRAVEDIDWDSLTVKGTCQDIEKRYLRLTSAPDSSTVRPEEVLEKALLMVLSSLKNYLYKCDQLKSIRQDLTVQRIRNELTAKVYEAHARLALEAGDLPEYNQCQSQLKSLYAEGIKGCHMEFSAYNLLCVIMHSSNNRDLLSSMARLSNEMKKDEAVKHALAVRAAVTSGNYVKFFRLYKNAPNLNTCLMDLYVEKMRFEAVKCMSRSYRPTVPLVFISQVLGFSSFSPLSEEGTDEKDNDGLVECEEWLRAHGACLIVDTSGETQLDTKNSSSNLLMPEPEDAVAHGDAALAVNDFLTRTN